MNLLSFINQPYLFYYKGRRIIFLLLIIFVLAFYISFVLRPHNINPDELKFSYLWICVIHAGLATLVVGLFAKVVLIYFDTDVWKIKSELLLVLSMTFTIGIVNFLIRDLIYENTQNWESYIFLEEMTNTFVIGSLIIFVVVIINYNFQNSRNKSLASSLTWNEKLTARQQPEVVRIETPLKSENFVLAVNQFLYARAEGNYIEIYQHNDGEIIKLLKRMTLTSLHKYLSEFPFILKTHRSYLVNIQNEIKVSGNAKGLWIDFQNINMEAIPVSRKNVLAFKQQHQPA